MSFTRVGYESQDSMDSGTRFLHFLTLASYLIRVVIYCHYIDKFKNGMLTTLADVCFKDV